MLSVIQLPSVRDSVRKNIFIKLEITQYRDVNGQLEYHGCFALPEA